MRAIVTRRLPVLLATCLIASCASSPLPTPEKASADL
ncbi:MAG: cytochrome c5 family protein, partial [Verrucomicrobiaceae bacterium]